MNKIFKAMRTFFIPWYNSKPFHVALPELVVATKGPLEPSYDRECGKYLLVLFKE
jgi:hypothetical protein